MRLSELESEVFINAGNKGNMELYSKSGSGYEMAE
jgi:hypothetical protein